LLVVHDGIVELGDAPGWGVEIKPTWLKDTDRKVSETV